MTAWVDDITDWCNNDNNNNQGDQIFITLFRNTGSTRPKEPQHEAQRVESGYGSWEGQPAPSPPARRSGGALCGVRGGTPASQRFYHILSALNRSS